MDVKDEVLLQLFNKSKLRNGTKTFLEPKFFSIIVKFKKLGFSAPLSYAFTNLLNLMRIFLTFSLACLLYLLTVRKFLHIGER